MAKESIITCKHCGAQIAASAKTCPQCGGKNKKPFYKRAWFIILLVLVIGFIALGSSGDDDGKASSAPAEEEEEIVYTPCTVGQLNKELESNAMKAEQTYNDQYVELTGKLNVIDSDGSYISLTDPSDPFDLLGIQCSFTDDAQKEVIMNCAIGDILVVKGQITEVGEIFGYYLDIAEVSKAG